MAVLPAVVSSGALERANGRLFAGQIVTNQFLGPPLGALAFTAVHWLPPVLDAITFLASAALLIGLHAPDDRRPRRSPGDDQSQTAASTPSRLAALRSDVRAGLRFIWSHHDLRLLALAAGVINLAETAAMSVAVLWATGPLDLGAVGYGLVLGVSATGGVIGSLAAERVAARLGGRTAIVAAVATFAIGLALIAAIPSAITLVTGLGLTGAAAQVWNVVAVTYRQRVTPDALLGRVMAAYRFVAYGSFPIGALAGGAIAATWNERATFVVAALSITVLAVVVAARLGPIDPDTADGTNH
jgi:predicted MFS family arabinose efflux permease